jgi:hypothetical protein
MLKGKAMTSLVVLCLFLIVGCGNHVIKDQAGNLVESTVETPADLVEVPSITPGPTWTQLPVETTASTEPTEEEDEVIDWIPSGDAVNFIGEVITVHVDVSYCAYKPEVTGAPTFCNDQPFPNHTFTYLMWGVDLSQFDAQCVLVTGEIVEYDGKPQIVVENEDQIMPCTP